MRKPQPHELAALIAVMAIANTVGHASENFDELPTITVTGTVDPVTVYVTPDSIIQTGQTIISVPAGQASSQQQTTVKHAINCASAYGGSGPKNTPGSHAGPAPNWKTYYVSDYAWTNSQNWVAVYANSSSPPINAGPWTEADGVTSSSQQTSWIYGLSKGNQTKVGLIDTFAHEFAHQWGAVDNPKNPVDDAGTIAAAAVAAYKADKGAKCGGL